MSRESIYEVWAPPDALWSRWAKPVLFACRNALPPASASLPDPVDVTWAPVPSENVALVLDLPGNQGVLMGLALAERGYRPVPLYNAVPNPQPYLQTENSTREMVTLVDVKPIMAALWDWAPGLGGISLPPKAPPAFLLDANRRGTQAPLAGCFDNRSVSFTTDFPSANFLLAHNFHRALLAQMYGNQPQPDLAHTLRRWQEAGIGIHLKRFDTTGPPTPLVVERPSRFGSLWYRFWTLLGLTRNELGGFGGLIAEPGGG